MQTSWLNFLTRSIVLGVVLALALLLLIPDLRHADQNGWGWFGERDTLPPRMSYSAGISQATPAVVNIYSTRFDTRPVFFRRQQVQRTSLGSGVIVDSTGYILTCYHVIQNAEQILVGVQDGRVLAAQLAGFDAFTDLALLKVDEENLPVIPQQTDTQVRTGDLVFAIGNPYNLGQTTTQGIVSATGRAGLVGNSYVDFIQTDTVLNQGNSGGALVDSNGILVGINNANYKLRDNFRRERDVAGVFFAVPYRIARKVMLDIIEYGKVIRGYLGINGEDRRIMVDSETLIMDQGAFISNIEPGGPAEQAGLEVGDLITAVDGRTIQSTQQVLSLVENTEPGKVLSFQVLRNEQQLDIAVTIGELSL